MKMRSLISILHPCLSLLLVLTLITGCAWEKSPINISVCYKADNGQQSFGISKLKETVSVGYVSDPSKADLVVITSTDLSERYNCLSDYSSLNPEGFLANAKSAMKCLYDKVSPFISVNEIIETVVLDTNLISIKDYVSGNYKGEEKTDSLELASQLQKDGEKALKIAESIKTDKPTLIHEIDDIRTWSYPSLYFNEKLRGGTALQQYRITVDKEKQAESIKSLESALVYWKEVVAITGKYIDEISLTHLNNRYVTNENSRPLEKFSWANLMVEVENDIEIARSSSTDEIDLIRNSLPNVQLIVPEDASGKQIHLILDLSDDSQIAPMHDYRRIVINVTVSPFLNSLNKYNIVKL